MTESIKQAVRMKEIADRVAERLGEPSASYNPVSQEVFKAGSTEDARRRLIKMREDITVALLELRDVDNEDLEEADPAAADSYRDSLV